jgi:hypothetical protein
MGVLDNQTKVRKFLDDLMLSWFLDIIAKDTLTNPQNLEAYTDEMSHEDDVLLAGVAIDY